LEQHTVSESSLSKLVWPRCILLVAGCCLLLLGSFYCHKMVTWFVVTHFEHTVLLGLLLLQLEHNWPC
jgi:hypothetical protein